MIQLIREKWDIHWWSYSFNIKKRRCWGWNSKPKAMEWCVFCPNDNGGGG